MKTIITLLAIVTVSGSVEARKIPLDTCASHFDVGREILEGLSELVAIDVESLHDKDTTNLEIGRKIENMMVSVDFAVAHVSNYFRLLTECSACKSEVACNGLAKCLLELRMLGGVIGIQRAFMDNLSLIALSDEINQFIEDVITDVIDSVPQRCKDTVKRFIESASY